MRRLKVLGLFVFASTLLATALPRHLHAQRVAAMTSFRHSGAPKPVASLDLIGLYDQLNTYKAWWKETGKCAGIPDYVMRPDSVQFFYVNAIDFAPLPTDKPGRMMYAVTYAQHMQIFVSILQANTEKIIKHEMLHQMLYWWNESDWDDDSRGEFKRCKLDISAPIQ